MKNCIHLSKGKNVSNILQEHRRYRQREETNWMPSAYLSSVHIKNASKVMRDDQLMGYWLISFLWGKSEHAKLDTVDGKAPVEYIHKNV